MIVADVIAKVGQIGLRAEEAAIANVTAVQVENEIAKNIVNTVTVAQELERVVGKSVSRDAPIEIKAALHASRWGLLLQLEEMLSMVVKADIEVIAKVAAVVKTGQTVVGEDEGNVKGGYDQMIAKAEDERGEAKKEEVQGYRVIVRSDLDDKR
jgi:hypothetical protein